jgi:uncharacterized repeat protein (TIGR03803 family)
MRQSLGLCLALGAFVSAAGAQQFTNLYSFSDGRDGAYPEAGLLLSGNTLYGTAYSGAAGQGTVFSLNTNGTSFKTLYAFAGGGDGSNPAGSLILSGNTLYGTSSAANSYTWGTVFSLSASGTNFTTLYAFTNGSDGSYPEAGLVLSGSTLYGTAYAGGDANGDGTVFSLNTNGSGFKILYTFTNGSDGSYPEAGLVLSGGTLYGTASYGGYFVGGSVYSGSGTVFSLNTSGTGFKTLHAFAGGFDGDDPDGSLVLSGGTLYGTACQGGGGGVGTVFALNPSLPQTFTPLYAFTNGSDGANPQAGLILSGSTLYGTSAYGGSTNGDGAVFCLNTNGTGLKTLYAFTNGSDGANPLAGLILSGSTLYGTASGGGDANGDGTVFCLLTNGTGFQTLYAFTNGTDGADPMSDLILSGNTLYGTANQGGDADGDGTVFSLNTNGTGFKTMYAFTNGSDGANPMASLILSGNTLYGTAYRGGDYLGGTVFSLFINGKGFRALYAFASSSNGYWPAARLILAGNTLYGTASAGGDSDNGTVFSMNTNGTPFTTLYAFTNGSDGSAPLAGLILSGNTLYGTASAGGDSGYGTVFSLGTNGADFTTLYNFFGGGDGDSPQGSLLLWDATLYGTASRGGIENNGMVFALSLGSTSSVPVPIALNIQRAGQNVILSWNDPSAVFVLQSAPSLTGGFTNVTGAASPFTNGASAPRFFRLVAP